jgi:hypothetical protein
MRSFSDKAALEIQARAGDQDQAADRSGVGDAGEEFDPGNPHPHEIIEDQ